MPAAQNANPGRSAARDPGRRAVPGAAGGAGVVALAAGIGCVADVAAASLDEADVVVGATRETAGPPGAPRPPSEAAPSGML
ncbi:hypothetical protein [Kocuria sp.]|uniref:hypothetical protein n=1 Tax=Kocuria TaxID=57493 RepID=UPI0025B8C92B|nr:hypothetical protein [Kocuria sp.]